MRRWTNRNSRGFSIVEILIVVAIIGLLASIMVPNLVDAMHKAKQKRSMVDMRSTGMAWLSWVTDQVGAASAGQSKTYDYGGMAVVNYADLAARLRPSNTFFYMEEVPETDGWQQAYQFRQNVNMGASNIVLICSRGRDKLFDVCATNPIPVESFISTNYDTDIVWADGFFVRWPEGLSNN